ncbi:MAG TPA: BatA and WFA domain-containing protein [Bryobacteraceae bacterium]|nr:BatA and WFA domain-containing protein [Bryobacteraceae bacterium]
MGFLAPWALLGTAAVGLPVWLHLLRKHKTDPLPFSSLMFFERRTQSSIKHRRLEYLLLLALRAAVVVLLALAFARPFVESHFAGLTAGPKLTVLAIDNSFSMRQGDRLARARREAAEVASRLRAEDKLQVLAFGSQVHVMGDSAADLQTIQPGDTRSSYAELSRALRSIAQSARVPVEAHVFSDMQKSSLPSNFSDLRLGDGVRLVPHPLADRRDPNFAVESVNSPRRVYGAGKARIQATIAGYGTQEAARRVSLVLNGREIDSKSVVVPASGRASAEFLSVEVPFGLNRGEVRIDSADNLPDDDHFYFSVERAEARHVLFVHAGRNQRDALYFRTALEAAAESAYVLDAVPVEQCANLAPQKYAFVVVSDVPSLPPPFETALRNYVRAGGSVLVALGREAAAGSRVPVFDGAVADSRYFTRDGDRFQSASWLDEGHPSIQGAQHWDDVKFYQVVRVQAGSARVAARLGDETPLLLDKQVGEGRVLVFASTFDNVSNDFPLHASFVPFVEHTANYLARQEEGPANYLVGSFLELRQAKEQGAAVEVLDPKESRALTLEEATRAQNMPLAMAGFYDVKRPSGRHELVAVNADRRESDLDVISADTLALWQNTAQGARNATATGETEAPKPVEFWWYVLITVLALAVAESLLGNKHLTVGPT